MNFYITNDSTYVNKFDLNCLKFKNLRIFFDNGWTVGKNSIKKGTPNNFCNITFDKNLKIVHSKMRDFGLWYDNKSCTNFLELQNYLPVDGNIMFDEKWHVTYEKDFYKSSHTALAKKQTVDFICKILLKNTQEFLQQNEKDLVIFENNGLDSLVSRSIFDFLGVKYKTLKIKKLNYTMLQNQLIKKYYGFNQIQIFDQPTCIITGFYGDEYILRNPSYVQQLIKDDENDLVKIFNSINSCYMKDFFNHYYLKKCMNLQKQSKQLVKQMICNDVQIWHIDNTFVFSPFKDKKFLQLLDCDLETIISQITDGYLSKKVIENFNKSLLKNIDKSKNIKDPYWFTI